MIKVTQHPLVCRCEDCLAMFPPDRFEAAWAMPAVAGGERVVGRVPLGNPSASWSFVVYVDEQQRLLGDWPGFPGTRGARVELAGPPGARTISGTRDPALGALAEPIPLRRRAVERINARCMVEYGISPPDVADFIACPRHGEGIPALACSHVIGAERSDVVVLYGVDGDYPDVFCGPCLEAYAHGELAVAATVCSHCQQANLYRHTIVSRSWYGARPAAMP